MMFPNRRKKLGLTLNAGLVLLVIANVAAYFMQRGDHISESVSDGVSGWLFGMAITTLLIGIRRKNRIAGNWCGSAGRG
jgi:hypothetical protein